MKVKSESEVAQSYPTLQPTRLLHPWDFPGKSTGVGCHCLLRSTPLTEANIATGEKNDEGTAIMGPSLGFSRQEHWSRLPFPSPMHESEEGK